MGASGRRKAPDGPGRDADHGTDAVPEGAATESKSTRDRILDIALDLFTDQGYDQTSLREIAERLGFTKAALYYHFASKEEIFLALHERLHGLADECLWPPAGEAVTIESWGRLLDSFIDRIPPNRKLILMHERNRAAFEKLHHPEHQDQHDDLEGRLHGALSDPRISLRDRIRMGCAFAAVMGGMMFGVDRFGNADPDEMTGELKAALHDLLGSTTGAIDRA
jgi:AcrR family transcriptional regulator